MHNTLTALLILLGGIGLLWFGTDGFQAFTSERARAIEISEQKPTLPNVNLEDSDGNGFQLYDLKGKLILATFIYTSCGDVCPTLEMKFQEVYKQVPKKYLGEEIIFLSISFDPDRDTPQQLQEYSKHFLADNVTWKMVRVPNKEELRALLQTAGVIVIPDQTGGFQHNAAIYLIDSNSKMINIFDYNATSRITQKLQSLVEQ